MKTQKSPLDINHCNEDNVIGQAKQFAIGSKNIGKAA